MLNGWPNVCFLLEQRTPKLIINRSRSVIAWIQFIDHESNHESNHDSNWIKIGFKLESNHYSNWNRLTIQIVDSNWNRFTNRIMVQIRIESRFKLDSNWIQFLKKFRHQTGHPVSNTWSCCTILTINININTISTINTTGDHFGPNGTQTTTRYHF